MLWNHHVEAVLPGEARVPLSWPRRRLACTRRPVRPRLPLGDSGTPELGRSSRVPSASGTSRPHGPDGSTAVILPHPEESERRHGASRAHGRRRAACSRGRHCCSTTGLDRAPGSEVRPPAGGDERWWGRVTVAVSSLHRCPRAASLPRRSAGLPHAQFLTRNGATSKPPPAAPTSPRLSPHSRSESPALGQSLGSSRGAECRGPRQRPL